VKAKRGREIVRARKTQKVEECGLRLGKELLGNLNGGIATVSPPWTATPC
jgi:hypothetical protein